MWHTRSWWPCLIFGVVLALASCSDGMREPEPEAESDADSEEPGASEDQLGTPSSEDHPVAVLSTTLGDITIELYPVQAPQSVENFLTYVREGFYDGTIFHRVVPGFVIQGGGFTPDMVEKPNRPPIQNEASNGLSNARGTVAMARTPDPHSATSQFFINLKDNTPLDFRAETARDWGYAVFGNVIDGMDVVERIAQVPTTTSGPHQGVPMDPVVIRSARVRGE